MKTLLTLLLLVSFFALYSQNIQEQIVPSLKSFNKLLPAPSMIGKSLLVEPKHDLVLGMKFPTALVWTTDASHLTKSGRMTHALVAVTINLGQKKKWYWYLIDAAVNWCARSLGFHTSYSWLIGGKK